ncbi:MAG: RNA 2',3'-cyclic phosphodiesterase [Planctomycetota bacterium]|nr:RNA 2',3'-cyclic phosphodiesterase [Planctomycetota bacterium]
MKRRAVDREHRQRSRWVRLFCALHPEPIGARKLLEAMATAEDLPAHRLTPELQVHMTLVFIGDVDLADVAEIKESVGRAAAAVDPICWTPDRIGTLPDRDQVRTVAAKGPTCGALDELHRRLTQRLVRHKKRRPFLPHMTLARFTPPHEEIGWNRPLEMVEFSFDTVQLMQSRLLPTGADHQQLLCASLRGR